jgi:hypothetical protein
MSMRAITRLFLWTTAWVWMTGLIGILPLQGTPLDHKAEIFTDTPSAREQHLQILLEHLNYPAELYWTESAPPATSQASPGRIRMAILVTVLIGGMLRFLTSGTVRRFFRETLDPLEWQSYQ